MRRKAASAPQCEHGKREQRRNAPGLESKNPFILAEYSAPLVHAAYPAATYGNFPARNCSKQSSISGQAVAGFMYPAAGHVL